jgi:hypothetical protein
MHQISLGPIETLDCVADCNSLNSGSWNDGHSCKTSYFKQRDLY